MIAITDNEWRQWLRAWGAPPNSSASRGAPMSQGMIAIVDDDDAVRRAIMSLVRSLGYDVSAFSSAEAFLESEQINDTSCLVTDLQMPGLSGIDLQDRLIAEGYRIPVIFLTGHPDDDVRIRAIKTGAVGFLTKPCNSDHLLGCLEKMRSGSSPTL